MDNNYGHWKAHTHMTIEGLYWYKVSILINLFAYLSHPIFYCYHFKQKSSSEQREIDHDSNTDVEAAPSRSTIIYPYADQASMMAMKQIRARENGGEDINSSHDAPQSIFANTLLVDFTHILATDEELAEAIETDFLRFEPFLRQAIKVFITELHPELPDQMDQLYFCAVHHTPTIWPVRALRTNAIGRLSSLSGTVTRTSEVHPELLRGSFRCHKCGLLAELIPQQFHYTRPTVCRNVRCGNKSTAQFILDPTRSEFTDWQKLRVQENSDEIPPGCMPRTLNVYVRGEMVERCKAGDKCILTGAFVVLPDGSALARAGEATLSHSTSSGDGNGGVRGLKATGVKELTYRTAFVAASVLPSNARTTTTTKSTGVGGSSSHLASLLYGNHLSTKYNDPTQEEVVMEFSRQERDDIRRMQATPGLYEEMAASVAPNTFGHREIKKGLLLMLLGGVHKTTPEGISLRGDINVCIVGDPSTAKSRFLQYVYGFLPSRAVYTSGKASSAAGLTAAVQRDQDTGEYCIEAGAMMLADNGICCIDE